jgi:predicted molibdopterin-dependent oxidoreductase YjgC
MHSHPPASAFRRIEQEGPTLSFSFEGEAMAARAGDSVAAALLAAGVARFGERPVSGAERGCWCLMGVCFDCLVEIDGVAGRQACQTQVVDGMRVRRQRLAGGEA